MSRRIFLQACSAAALAGPGAVFGKTVDDQLVKSESQAFPEWRPDSSRRAGEWVARYARRRLRAAARERLDYAVAMHFHGDRVGEVSATSPLSASGEYRLTGLADVAEQMTIGRLIDRGYPA